MSKSNELDVAADLAFGQSMSDLRAVLEHRLATFPKITRDKLIDLAFDTIPLGELIELLTCGGYVMKEAPDPPRPQETPSEGAFRAALQLTEEKTLMRVAAAAEHLARSEPDKSGRDIYAALAHALRREVKL